MERAALSLAAAVVSPILTKLGAAPASYFGGDISREDLRNLQIVIVPKIKLVIRLAERIDSPQLKPWMMNLQAAAYDAEDMLDLYEYKRMKNEVRPPTSLQKIKAKAKEKFALFLTKTELQKSFEKLMQSAAEADKFTYATQEHYTIRQPTTFPGLSEPLFGRDEESSALLNMLITEPNESGSHRNVTLHAIQGIGGAGKTALARQVYKDARVEEHFDSKIWIHVTRTFDPNSITKEIIEAVEKDSFAPVGNLALLQKILGEALRSKRFLLVLDDVWTEDDRLWRLFLVPLWQGGAAGSRILITTRLEETTQVLRVKHENIVALKELNLEECRSILKHYAFDDANKSVEDPELASIGEMILLKIKNSPLAARLVGCLLKTRVCAEAWRMILNRNLLGDTLDVILLSFQHLPPHLQRCFAICSLYPKGVRYGYYDLASLWVANGYVEAIGNESLEDKCRQCLDDLLSYSLFQSDSNGMYAIHDLVHDLAETVSKDYCFRIDGDDPVSIPSTVIHLSIASGKLDLHMPGILKLARLRTFIILPYSDVGPNITREHTKAMFKKLTKLRVLKFGRCPVWELNSSVANLKHLRYLQFHLGKRLTESLANLCHLHFFEQNVLDFLPGVWCQYYSPIKVSAMEVDVFSSDFANHRGCPQLDVNYKEYGPLRYTSCMGG